MNTFWSWFIRPFAEILAGLVIFLIFGLALFMIVLADQAHSRRKKRKEQRAKNTAHHQGD